MTRWFRLALAGPCLAALVGCSFDTATYTLDRYGLTKGVNVTLRCRDTYEVYDRPEAASLIVITNVLNETLAACVDNGPPLAERQREVARIFLDEKTNRPLCTIVGETPLTAVHREFSYRCPADPAAQSPRPSRN
ncbi:hypothetical protein [uncultured Enterovirga sp.]|uniref:hypothetical protein n=1 Tax=uncultured Enterovirga sp. TaxID=2026352 RepID=UPI0035CA1665